MPNHHITRSDVQNARTAYGAREPRDLFYRTAIELVSLSIDGKTSLTLTDAIAGLLQTWNREFYRFRGGFSEQHYGEIDTLLREHLPTILKYRARRISDLVETDLAEVNRIFHAFEVVLGPVGAAKSLHLLAPGYFPLWDRKITAAYGLSLGSTGTNSSKYWQMMFYSFEQAQSLIDEGYTGNPLKAIDEFNYCHFSREWI